MNDTKRDPSCTCKILLPGEVRLWCEHCRPLPMNDTDGPVHAFFGLTYSSYQVVPRVLAQNMPDDWQARFVACMEEMEAAFAHIKTPPGYEVHPAEEVVVSELTTSQQWATGITSEWDDDRNEEVHHDRDGNEVDPASRVMVPVSDPLPPYSRGRTRVPRADQLLDRAAESLVRADKLIEKATPSGDEG